MKLLIKLTLFLLTLGHISISLAENTTGYEVELIIFENANGRYLNSEDWSYNDSLQNVAIETFGKDTSKDPEYTELDWSSAKLANNLNRLLDNRNYKVLVNKRWKQTGLDKNETINIPVGKPTVDASTINQDNNSSDDIIGNINPEADIESYISGNVKLIMSRYLHFNVNLQFFKPMLNNQAEYEFRSFPIVSTRRMKSREVHYIDHPLVGIVVLATPYKIKAKG